jgi:RNA polymerase sigma factor (sigma-70 family)
MSSLASSGEAPKVFPNTRWSVVLAAARRDSPESAKALETICQAYWHPLYSYVRRCGQSEHDAQDLTQEFFGRLLEKNWLENADQAKGRLRSFLISAMKHFMAKEWRHASAQKRGGHQVHTSLDTTPSESCFLADSKLSPDEVFDKEWALTLLDLTVKKLQLEFTAAGKAADFEALKGCLMAEHGGIDYDGLAKQLGVNPGAARVAAHRLRKRFREIYREEISQTLTEGADLEGELRHLAAALACEG